MIQIDMPMPERCKGCRFTDFISYKAALCCIPLRRPIATYERIGDTGREYELIYLDGADEKRHDDCPLKEVSEGCKDMYVAWLEHELAKALCKTERE